MNGRVEAIRERLVAALAGSYRENRQFFGFDASLAGLPAGFGAAVAAADGAFCDAGSRNVTFASARSLSRRSSPARATDAGISACASSAPRLRESPRSRAIARSMPRSAISCKPTSMHWPSTRAHRRRIDERPWAKRRGTASAAAVRMLSAGCLMQRFRLRGRQPGLKIRAPHKKIRWPAPAFGAAQLARHPYSLPMPARAVHPRLLFPCA